MTVDVQGRQVTLSNLDKVLYPATGFTKGDLIDYYRAAGPVLLPHVESRPVTFRRYPEGVRGEGFFAKQRPPHAPDWVRTVRLPSPGSTMGRSTVDYVLLCDLPTLVWAANLAALEIHVPAWRVDDQGRPTPPDRMIYDLDPGEPATIVEGWGRAVRRSSASHRRTAVGTRVLKTRICRAGGPGPGGCSGSARLEAGRDGSPSTGFSAGQLRYGRGLAEAALSAKEPADRLTVLISASSSQ
ncbi:MAG: non-homologous end-joining DNA ligase LigD [Blastococcus sp.]